MCFYMHASISWDSALEVIREGTHSHQIHCYLVHDMGDYSLETLYSHDILSFPNVAMF